MAKRGRKPGKLIGSVGPYSLTPSVQKKIINGIILGLPDRMLGPFAGIDRQSYYDWLERGARANEAKLKGKEVPGSERVYMDLANAAEEAVSQMVARSLLVIDKAAQGVRNPDGTFVLPPNWQAAMTKLERKLPDDFGRKDRIEHSGDQDKPIKIKLRWYDEVRDETSGAAQEDQT